VGDRRTLIADAAIRTLAEAGSRGLTHRAVDRAAGLPVGSTSYYLRTRADLLRAAVDRLAELDAAALGPAAGGSLVDDLAEVVHQLLTVDRDRLLARYELALESVRRPELRELLAAGTKRVRETIAERLVEPPGQDADPEAVAERADAVLALVEGLLFAELTAFEGSRRTPGQIRAALARVVGAA
jgi:DNA-binding transcriptional regulator YbjK